MLHEVNSNYFQGSSLSDDKRNMKIFKTYTMIIKGMSTTIFFKHLYKDMFLRDEQEATPLFPSAKTMLDFLCAQKL